MFMSVCVSVRMCAYVCACVCYSKWTKVLAPYFDFP